MIDVSETLVLKTAETRIDEILKGISPMHYVLQYFVVLSYWFSGIKEKHHFNFLGRYNQFLRDRGKLVAQVNGKVKYQDLLSAVLLEVKV